MTANSIEPQPVIDLVERYVDDEISEVGKYINREHLDSSAVWSLHQLVRDVYALGVLDGSNQERDRARRQHQRDRDAAKGAA